MKQLLDWYINKNVRLFDSIEGTPSNILGGALTLVLIVLLVVHLASGLPAWLLGLSCIVIAIETIVNALGRYLTK